MLTVAVCIPALRLFGLKLNELVLPGAMLGSGELDPDPVRAKLVAFAPVIEIVNAPVAWSPVFVTVNDVAVIWLYPKVAVAKTKGEGTGLPPVVIEIAYELTTKRTLKLAVIPLSPDTVIVASCVPTASPVLG